MSGAPYQEPMIPERKGSSKMIPARLRLPCHVKCKSDADPEYLTRGLHRGRKAALRQKKVEE